MTFDEFIEKYGENPDYDSIPAMDFYEVLDSNRELFETLHEEGALNQHWLYEPVRRKTITDLEFLNLFTWDSNPFGGFDAPIADNITVGPDYKNLYGMFIKKDPSKSLSHLSEYKTRLTLYPRGSGKTSLAVLDLVQWVLYDYKIRILVLSAADDLAANIVDEARGFFTIKEARPTLLNMFWSEHCLLEKDLGPSGSYTSPEWEKQNIKRREPTIMSRGITASVQGFHFEVISADDVVETRNSSESQCLEVRKKVGITRKTLRNFGYMLIRGTRYAEEDWYGEILSKMEVGEFKKEEFSITEYKISNLSRKTICLVGAAMTIKPDAEIELAKYNIPREQWFRKVGPDGVVLLMSGNPTLTYDNLLVEYEDDAGAFETQQRQNVNPPTQQMFTKELILQNTVSWTDIPPFGRVTHCWDLNGGKGKTGNDFSVGSACLWDNKGVGYIIDLICQNFPDPISTARAIVSFAMKHHPDIISIEDSPGVRNLAPTIEREADATTDLYVKQLVRRIHWRPLDTTKDAKKNRISSLYPIVKYGQLKFASYLPDREKMITQFCRPVTRNSKNDIPDCISFQMSFAPPPQTTSEDRKKVEEERNQQRTAAIQKSSWEMVFTEGWRNPMIDQAPPQSLEFEIPEEPILPSQTSYDDGLDSILGYGITG